MGIMVRDIGFEPMMRDSESLALPLGESRIKKVNVLYTFTFLNQENIILFQQLLIVLQVLLS